MKQYQVMFLKPDGQLAGETVKARTAGDAIARALFNLTKNGVVIDYVVEWKEVGS
jgi:hypothetical protein